MKFSIKYFFSKRDNLSFWWYLPKKPLIENALFKYLLKQSTKN